MISLLLAVTLLPTQVDTLQPAKTVADKINTTSFEEVVTKDQLDKALNISDVLVTVPDVQLTDYGLAGSKYLSSRGLGTAHVGVFYDGIPVRDYQNNQVDLNRFDVRNLSSISIHSSQRNSLLLPASAYTSATTLYLVSDTPSTNQYQAQLSYGTYNYLSGNVGIAQHFGDHSIIVTGSLLNTDGYHDNGDFKSAYAEVGYYWKGLKSKVKYNHDALGTPGSLDWPSDGRQVDNNWLAQVLYEKIWKSWGINVASKFSRDYMHYWDSWGDNTYNQTSGYANASVLYSPADFVVLPLAQDLAIANLNCDVQDFPGTHRVESNTVANVKFVWKNFNLLGTGAFVSVLDGDKKWTKFVPSVTASFDNRVVSVFASYRHLFRTPNINELYYPYYSNSNLKPEFVKQANLGAKLSLGDFVASVDAYYNSVTDKIVSVAPAYLPENYAKVYGKGITSYIDYHHDWGNLELSSKLSYAFEQVESDGVQLAYVPKHAVTGSVNVRFYNTTLNVTDTFKDKRYDSYGTELPSWNTLNISITQNVPTKAGVFSITGLLNNALNKEYSIVPGYPMPGRMWRVSLAWKF